MELIAAVCLFVAIAWFLRLRGSGYRRSLLLAAVTWGTLTVVITEALSLFHALTYAALLSSWIVVALCTAAMIVHRLRSRQREPAPRITPVGVKLAFATGWGLIGWIVVVATVTGMAGVASAPANWDSMTYHLPRVMHWIYNRSVGHYPVGYLHQLYHPPFAEFGILHLQILSGGDRFAFAVQWLAMIGALLAVSGIAEQLGAGRHGQLLAAVFAATLPAGIAQAESTQNNYVLAFWLLCLILAIIDLQSDDRANRMKHAGAAGCSLGLALLTKGTAYLFVLPFLGWLVVAALAGRRKLAVLAVAGAIAMSLNLPHWARNYRTFGTPLVPASDVALFRVQGMSPRLWASNVVGQCSLQLWPQGKSAAATMQTKCFWLCGRLGLDPGDDRLVTPGEHFEIRPYNIHEDLVGNPLHLGVIVLAAVFLLLTWLGRRRDSPVPISRPARSRLGPGMLLALVGVCFLTFCAGVRWMPFNGRLELPLFVLAAAPAGVALERLRPRLLSSAIALVLAAMSISILRWNPTHPLQGENSIFKHPREQQYFVMRPSVGRSSIAVADLLAIRAPHGPVALAGHVEWEYPWWVLLQNRAGKMREIVAIPSAVVPPGCSTPDPAKMSAIIVMDPALLADLTSGPCAGWNQTTVGRYTILWPAGKGVGSGR